MAYEALKGIVAAPMQPMNPDYSIDWVSLRSYIDWIAAAGPTAIAMNMDASEGPTLTRDEQIEVVTVCREVIADRCPLFSGLIVGSTAEGVSWGNELKAAGAQGLAAFPPLPTFLGNPVPTEMIYAYHRALADGIGLPLVAFQFPKAFGIDYRPEALRKLSEIEEVIGLKEASFDTPKTVETIETAAALPRKIGIMTGSDTFIFEAMVMGCDGALIGFAGTATAELIRMYEAVERADYGTGKEIWSRLGPLARFCWSPPLRDYRPRMKEVLVMQGRIAHTTVRPPQLGISDEERDILRGLAERAGLIRQNEVLRAASD